MKLVGFMLLSIITLGACSSKKPVIGFMLPHMSIMRYTIEKEVFIAKASELGAEVRFASANNDEEHQIAQLDSLIGQGIDVLVLDPVNRFNAAAMVRKAHEKGIKVLSYDRLISNCTVDAFISFDAELTGQQMAQAAMKVKPSGNYIILGGDKKDINAIGVEKGQMKVLESAVKSGDIKIKYNVFVEKWSEEEAAMEVAQYIQLSDEVPDVILASSDVLAKGAINVLKKENLAGSVVVTGNGGELFACKNINAGFQQMTVYKPVKKLAALAVELSLKMLRNEQVGDILNGKMNNDAADIPSRFLETIPVFKDNIKSTVIADGMFTEADLLK